MRCTDFALPHAPLSSGRHERVHSLSLPPSAPSPSRVVRRLWGYGAATLAVFVYAGYSISGPAPAKTTTTTTTVQTIKH